MTYSNKNRKNQVQTDNEFLRDIQNDLSESDSRIKKYLAKNLISDLAGIYTANSNQEEKEAQIIKKRQENATDAMRNFAVNIHDYRNTYNLFEKISNLTSCNIKAKQLENLCGNYSGLLHFLKVKFDRPRPYEACKNLKIKIDLLVDKRYENGSFPSGHAFEAYLIANFLTQKDKANKDLYLFAAKKISNSRIIAGVHYPSDILGGFILANQIHMHAI